MICFFSLHEQDCVIEDEHGVEVGDLAKAVEVATEASRDIMSSEVRAGRLCLSDFILIKDKQHMVIGKVLFRDSLQLAGNS